MMAKSTEWKLLSFIISTLQTGMKIWIFFLSCKNNSFTNKTHKWVIKIIFSAEENEEFISSSHHVIFFFVYMYIDQTDVLHTQTTMLYFPAKHSCLYYILHCWVHFCIFYACIVTSKENHHYLYFFVRVTTKGHCMVDQSCTFKIFVHV